MPAVDPELIQPLTAITERLRRRPGVANLRTLKKLSETYGFTTFVEQHNDATQTNTTIRLSISGHVLLIDIDFTVSTSTTAAASHGSPSPTHDASTLITEYGDLDRTCISDVSISSAITPDAIDGESWDFIEGFSGSLSASAVLFANLKRETLDAFNKNLRVLLQFDRLSGVKPCDLFTVFAELASGLVKQMELERCDAKVKDPNDVVLSVGRVACNYGEKVGLFLKYWIDDRHVNRWIKENKGVDVDEAEYVIHFKVRESLKDDAIGEGNNNNNHSVIPPVLTSRLFNSEFGEWNIEKGSKIEECLQNIVMEFCPPVWVPADLIDSYCLEYETIVPGNCVNHDSDIVDEVYSSVNETGEYLGDKLTLSMLVGCEMVLLRKSELGDLNNLSALIAGVRSWCKLASILRKTVTGDIHTVVTVSAIDVSCVDIVAEMKAENVERNGATNLALRLVAGFAESVLHQEQEQKEDQQGVVATVEAVETLAW